MGTTRKRLTNLDLLKVVSMMMIVCLHCLSKGGVLKAATLSDPNYYVAWLLEFLSVVAVNCFVMCSGYLMAKNNFKFSKLVNLWLQIVVINAGLLLLALISGEKELSLNTLMLAVMPINMRLYWFMSAYFALYLLSPLLIWIVNKLTVKQLKMVVITLIAVFSLSPWQWTKIEEGYHFAWFCVLFFVAAYVRRADLFNRKAGEYIGYYFLLTFVLLALNIAVTIVSKKISAVSVINPSDYNFILTFLSSLMLFAGFKNIRINNVRLGSFISFVSSLTLGVYLIHENRNTRDALWRIINPSQYLDKPYFVLYIIASIVAIFCVCAFLEYFRQLLFKLFGVARLTEKIGDKLDSLKDKVFDSHIIERM